MNENENVNVEQKQEESQKRRPALAGPILLIVAGVLFLLNNLGVLPWGIWGSLARMWPVVLILIGIELLIGRRSVWASALVLLLSLTVLAVVFAVAAVPALAPDRSETESVSQPLGDAKKGEVRLEPGIGRLSLSASTDPSTLAQGTIKHSEREDLVQESSVSDDTAYLGLRGSGREWLGFGMPGERRWDLSLSPAVPISLVVDGGISESRLDLSGLNVERLELKTGVGRMEVSLPETGTIHGSIDGGVGSTLLVVDRATHLTLRVTKGIGSLRVPAGYSQAGDVYTSEGAEGGPTADLSINAGIGSVTIQEGP